MERYRKSVILLIIGLAICIENASSQQCSPLTTLRDLNHGFFKIIGVTTKIQNYENLTGLGLFLEKWLQSAMCNFYLDVTDALLVENMDGGSCR